MSRINSYEIAQFIEQFETIGQATDNILYFLQNIEETGCISDDIGERVVNNLCPRTTRISEVLREIDELLKKNGLI